MRMNIVFAGLERDKSNDVLRRMNGLLAPFFRAIEVLQLRCLYIGPGAWDGAVDCDKSATAAMCGWLSALPAREKALDWVDTEENILPGDYCEGLCAYFDMYPADVIVFAPTLSGKQLGRFAAAKKGFICYTEVRSVDAVLPVLKVRRKVYSAHGDGVFRGVYGKTVLIGAAAGGSGMAELIGDAAAGGSGMAELIGDAAAGGSGMAELFGHAAADSCMSEPDIFAAPANIYINNVAALWQNTEQMRRVFCRQLSVIPKPAVGNLTEAPLVFVGGKGMKTKENFMRLEALARKFGAACGCTRPAALGGWADYSRVVGISGGSLRAELCITFGVSGAAPFLYGVENVRHLVAVNKDDRAPVFSRADEGIVEDCIKIIEAMEGFKWPI